MAVFRLGVLRDLFGRNDGGSKPAEAEAVASPAPQQPSLQLVVPQSPPSEPAADSVAEDGSPANPVTAAATASAAPREPVRGSADAVEPVAKAGDSTANDNEPAAAPDPTSDTGQQPATDWEAAAKATKEPVQQSPARPQRGGKDKAVARAVRKPAEASDSYTAADIEVLEGLEPVRRRPGMYIGGTDEKALHHLFAEVIDNSMDEAVAGHATWIEVELEAGGWLTVNDNGRGIPVDPHPKFKNKSALEVIMTTLHSGGKFDSKVYNCLLYTSPSPRD